MSYVKTSFAIFAVLSREEAERIGRLNYKEFLRDLDTRGVQQARLAASGLKDKERFLELYSPAAAYLLATQGFGRRKGTGFFSLKNCKRKYWRNY